MFSTWSRQVPSFREPVIAPTVDPDNTGSLVCVKVAAEWLPFIAGALSQLRQDSTWQGTDSERLLAIQRATDLIGILFSATSEGCAMPFDIRFKPTDNCILQKSTDGGVSWVDVGSLVDCFSTNFSAAIAADIASGVLTGGVSDPRTQGTPNPPWPSGSVPSGQSAPCLAGANLSAYTKQYMDNTISGLNAGATFTSIASSSLGIIGLLFAVTNPIVDVILGVVATLVGIGAGALSSALTSAVYDTLKCISSLHVGADGSCNQTQFNSITSDVSAQIGGIAGTAINAFLNSIGPNGVTKAGAVAGIQSADCSACVGWCYKFDFTSTDGGFVQAGAGPTNWVSGQGWQGLDGGTADAYIYKTFGAVHVDSMDCIWTLTTPDNNDTQSLHSYLSGGQNAAASYHTHNVTNHKETLTINATIDKVLLDINAASSHNAVDVTIVSCTLRSASGSNPFGSNNC